VEDVDRMRFVARAKQLGLRPEEISELIALRGDGNCPPVRTRLGALVETKLAETRQLIGELAAFEAELAGLSRGLDAGPAPAACGQGCGCPDHPLPSESVPVACTLEATQAGDRLAQWRAVVSAASVSTPASDGWRLRFPLDSELAARVSALVVAEQACCPFLGFRLGLHPDAVDLHVTVPAEARPLAAELFTADDRSTAAG
jgi:MerR family transcriptional regulator, copper efflux regulator